MDFQVPIDQRYQPGVYDALVSPFLFSLGAGKDDPPRTKLTFKGQPKLKCSEIFGTDWVIA